jgi:hypothetical protein
MRPHVEPVLGGDGGHPGDVALEAIEVDHQRRRVGGRPGLAGEVSPGLGPGLRESHVFALRTSAG